MIFNPPPLHLHHNIHLYAQLCHRFSAKKSHLKIASYSLPTGPLAWPYDPLEGLDRYNDPQFVILHILLSVIELKVSLYLLFEVLLKCFLSGI
jgi:hypothetical protein